MHKKGGESFTIRELACPILNFAASSTLTLKAFVSHVRKVHWKNVGDELLSLMYFERFAIVEPGHNVAESSFLCTVQQQMQTKREFDSQGKHGGLADDGIAIISHFIPDSRLFVFGCWLSKLTW